MPIPEDLKNSSETGFPGNLEAWQQATQEIRKQVLQNGWSEKKQAFVQHYDTEDLDASNLLMSIYGFLPYDDCRMVATVAAIYNELYQDGLVYRYRTSDGLAGSEGAFNICTFWLVDYLIGQGRFEEAQVILLRMENYANHLGLFSEEYDPQWRQALGNFPQAFTHIGCINSVVSLCKARVSAAMSPPRKKLPEIIVQKLTLKKFLLNPAERRAGDSSSAIAVDLKHLMNLLRGAFFRPAEDLDAELTVSGKTFLNAGGVQIDRERRTVYLSKVFKWYAGDFGTSDPERLHFIAPYLYDDKDRRFLERQAKNIRLEYLPYDWRLNRT